ncbi:MAG: HupE/UreJ family protein [Pseudomonadales bacterium]|nr:HupE/UreJ family protein [Pseudomonadales bacterium]
MNRIRPLIVFAVGLLSFMDITQGHEVRPAYLRLEATQTPSVTAETGASYEVLWKRPFNEDGVRLSPVFPEFCEETSSALDEVIGPVVVRQFRLDCDQTLVGSAIAIAGLELTVTDVMLHVGLRDGETMSYLMKPTSSAVVIETTGAPVWSYLLLGIEHLLFGIDHILFVVALMFFLTRLGPLIKTITAFTVAHSVTLGLSALDLVSLPQGPVEAVIALSILFLTVERLREDPNRPNPYSIVRNQTWVVAFAFGLLHGFGFAGALSEIGLPKGNLISALFLFNVGVELGQLLVIAIGLIFAWITRRIWVTVPQYVVQAPLYLVGIAAAYWLIERTAGILWFA